MHVLVKHTMTLSNCTCINGQTQSTLQILPMQSKQMTLEKIHVLTATTAGSMTVMVQSTIAYGIQMMLQRIVKNGAHIKMEALHPTRHVVHVEVVRELIQEAEEDILLVLLQRRRYLQQHPQRFDRLG